MYLAPESGYQQKVIVEQPHDGGKNVYQIELKKRYYLKSRSGQLYARLRLDISPFYNDYSLIHITYFANPNSSRNLMYDDKIDISTTEDTFYNFGKMAFDAGKYKEAMARLLTAYNHGDRPASALIGKMYHQGLGVGKDDKKAFEWYSLVVSLPNPEVERYAKMSGWFGYPPEAFYMIGMMYKNGMGVAKDLEKAFSSFKAGDYRGWLEAGEIYVNKGNLPMGHCYFDRVIYLNKWAKI